jgi:hypothetical protein
MWNERERRNEERELVYEISWMPLVVHGQLAPQEGRHECKT